MELKLVYRALRKVSDWTVTGYYSDCVVEGGENVPETGPLIIASTHHNELIDIAALTATIPYRRHVSFWAKSTMFANPITRAILESSGAIPVRRNPNNGSGSSAKTNNGDPSRSTLFRESSAALAAGQVIGVFPEGTSYTSYRILQVLPGAAWAAVEFLRSQQRGVKTGLKLVPVAVVYTDKARYRSRILVKYCPPIHVDDYAEELFEETADPDAASRSVVKKIMVQVEKQMMENTINAPDWDTLCAVRSARHFLWTDERNIKLADWVGVSQRLVTIFDNTLSPTTHLKSALTKYFALLHFTGIKHSILASLSPSSPTSSSSPPSHPLVQPTISLLTSLPVALIRLALFLPPLLFFTPGYILGRLSARWLASTEEEETQAQFKAVGGGLGVMTTFALVLGQLQRILTYHKLLMAFTLPRLKLDPGQMEVYMKPPRPPANPFVKGPPQGDTAVALEVVPIRAPGTSRELVRRLLDARDEAQEALSGYLREGTGEAEGEALVELLNARKNEGLTASRHQKGKTQQSLYDTDICPTNPSHP
ncbi:glycerol-3-phosphate O-acyltransferase [Laccaria bicolor S238N-H82]|uniref:Glycerol-3-phosphate O-acyltransferase n=1 Tax=Laccaria bicolor (strain S238N-H82 / ATCC MYA-4686) TaxID=486041 RepID=B0D6C9_LACBS|nr:glycerol-3-phosphate O-acyltransferase [Laccaria bicolor S238N-H82]EDR09927.1 glycerol-3-phosphate O-acyltransferase [Laccaria bicolor S238N-H82]|eukprot:XP_001879312.1 glycerol-3-phosphate O-acyltransferase [Laccaria bicolor S238N-H82]